MMVVVGVEMGVVATAGAACLHNSERVITARQCWNSQGNDQGSTLRGCCIEGKLLLGIPSVSLLNTAGARGRVRGLGIGVGPSRGGRGLGVVT